MSTSILLEMRKVTKSYSGFLALSEIDFDLRPGEVHVLFGENGAGKSTLISLIAGSNHPTSGAILFAGREVHLTSVHDARELGISAVFQEFSLIPTRTVSQNLFLGDEPTHCGWLDKKALRMQSEALLRQLDFGLDLNAQVETLSRAEQQMVEIAKAFRRQPSILILDEPTASLTEHETERLLDIVRKLKDEGVGIIYISHRMQEIRRIGDRITVLRDGRKIATVDAKETPESQLIEMMAGRKIDDIYPHIAHTPGKVVLEVQGLTTKDGSVIDSSLAVRAGEVVGIAGLVGCGKSEIMRAVVGIEDVAQGQVVFHGADVTRKSIAEMLRAGMFYLPPDRKKEGLILGFSSRRNITLSSLDEKKQRGALGLLSKRAIARLAHGISLRVDLAQKNINKTVGQLSGGNQQKVLFGKGLVRGIDLYIFDEPTVGVDVGTRSTLYALIKDLCEAGAAVVVISSDLPEVLELSHRLYVMRKGHVVAELHGDQINETNALHYFFERKENEPWIM